MTHDYDTTTDDSLKMLARKVEAFRKAERIVHISLKSGMWKRGLILDTTSADFFVLHERLEGEIAVFYLEVHDIELFTPKREPVAPAANKERV